MTVHVRPATTADALEARRILDAAMLEYGDVEALIETEHVLVAGDYRGGSDGSERLLGTVVLEPHEHERGAHVTAVAVRRRQRGRGVGSALIERGIEREGRLTAHFDGDVRPFYDRLGFALERTESDRYHGVAVASKES
ncbi:GNAT family N-acetyltransferase [Natronorubrum daqingense]|uniref:GNAT family N-acetyltransferase n=1 Tax=Natronorubrum daqingense TaxID=588898 RepID=A0A1N7FA35_9EURY|nr:GNAT family N-acetyltransferase [Natronorubrum daqingense]APX97643.1 GNAT family N-acetyltransferase [Natronorubrum daqingense]SIR97221.1 Ribosomal protein S18 acetylase RimI [Natronorubrum daqingense]